MENVAYGLRFGVAMIASFFVLGVSGTIAQTVTAASVSGPHGFFAENLAFSDDGRFLREVQFLPGTSADEQGHVRMVTFVAATGAIKHLFDLAPDTWFYSATTNGRIAVVSLDRNREETNPQFVLVDTETGRTKNIPSGWFDPVNQLADAGVSGDGQLVSAYTEDESHSPMVVSVYNWKTKKLLARRSQGFFAGGFMGGRVTPDGKIEFTNNRAGSVVVDPKSGKQLATVNPYGVRSPDGTWIVEFPDLILGVTVEDIPLENGMTGTAVGKLQIHLTEQQGTSPWHGAFCGATGKFIAATADTVRAFELPSGKQFAIFANESWSDNSGDWPIVACSRDGKGVAIRSGTRLTIHDLEP
jgi:hypothetical protein